MYCDTYFIIAQAVGEYFLVLSLKSMQVSYIEDLVLVICILMHLTALFLLTIVCLFSAQDHACF